MPSVEGTLRCGRACGTYWSEEKRTAPAGILASHQTRTPSRSSLSAPTTAPSPMTAPETTERSPIRERAPIRESVTTAPGSTTAPESSVLPEIRAPSPTKAPSPTTVPPVSFAPVATVAVGDPEEAARVRVRLLRELAANRESLVATHLSFPSVCHVAVDGDAFRWVPGPWVY